MQTADIFTKIIGEETSQIRDCVRRLHDRYCPETVHDLRVASLRVDFALKFFLTNAKGLRLKLKNCRSILGRSRNLDVLMAEIPEKYSGLKKWVHNRQQGARQAVARLVKSGLYHELIRGIESTRNHQRPGLVKTVRGPFCRTIKRVLKYRKRKIHGPRLHRLRSGFKKLHYACQFMGKIDPRRMRPALELVVRFQDLLGRRQNAMTCLEILPKTNARGSRTLMEYEKQNMNACEKKFRKLWRMNILVNGPLDDLYRWSKHYD